MGGARWREAAPQIGIGATIRGEIRWSLEPGSVAVNVKRGWLAIMLALKLSVEVERIDLMASGKSANGAQRSVNG